MKKSKRRIGHCRQISAILIVVLMISCIVTLLVSEKVSADSEECNQNELRLSDDSWDDSDENETISLKDKDIRIEMKYKNIPYTYNYYDNFIKNEISVYYKSYQLEEDEDYELEYRNADKAGTATVIVRGIGDYKEEVVLTYQITRLKIKHCYASDMVYTGKKILPYISASNVYSLKKGTDYIVKKISNNKKVGTARIKIQFIGNYMGSATMNFKILPKDPKKIRTIKRTGKAVTVTWSKTKNVSGYKIYTYRKNKLVLLKTTKKRRITIKPEKGKENLTIKVHGYKRVKGKTYVGYGNTKYDSVIPARAKIKIYRYSSYGLKTFPDKAGYYEYEHSTDKKFYYPNRWSGYLTPGGYVYFNCSMTYQKRVYVRMRRYAIVNGKRIYGKWSKVKSKVIK